MRAVDRGDLPLAESVIQRVVDLRGRYAEPRRGVAIDDEIGLQPLLLLIRVDIGHDRAVLERV